jgi:hypothetical protein
MTGSDSDDEAAAAWTMAAEILVKEGATILTLTHSPYSDDGRIRGSSHLWGSFEERLHAEGDKEKRTCVVKVDRFKDHDSSHGQWGFQLDEVEIEEHPGETSLVPRLDGEVKSQKSGKKQLKPRAAAALKTLRPFVTAHLRWRAGQETSFASIIAFAETARGELLRLRADDALTVQGEARLGTYTTKVGDVRPSLEITAAHVLALRQPKPAKTPAPAEQVESTYQ